MVSSNWGLINNTNDLCNKINSQISKTGNANSIFGSGIVGGNYSASMGSVFDIADRINKFTRGLNMNYSKGGATGTTGTMGSSGGGSNLFSQYTGALKGAAGNYGGVSLSQEQVNNAKIIADVGRQMGMSDKDIKTAIATAMQESSLKNINYGDRDSVGLFQQRPSCGWGTVEQCTTPTYAARKFFEGLQKIPNRNSMSLTQAAQKVQRSAFPDAYAKWENMANSITNSMFA